MSKLSFIIVLLLAATIAANEDNQKPAVILPETSSPSSTTTNGPSTPAGHVDEQKPALIVGDHQNPPHETRQKREEAPPAVAHDVTFSTLKPSSTQSPKQTKLPNEEIKACAQDYRPLCGSDGKTYSNLCTLNLAQQTDPTLVQAKMGEC